MGQADMLAALEYLALFDGARDAHAGGRATYAQSLHELAGQDRAFDAPAIKLLQKPYDDVLILPLALPRWRRGDRKPQLEALVVDAEGKSLEGLIAAELRLDDRALARAVDVEDRLGLALQATADMAARLVRIGVRVQHTEDVAPMVGREGHQLGDDALALLQVVRVVLQVGDAVDDHQPRLPSLDSRADNLHTLLGWLLAQGVELQERVYGRRVVPPREGSQPSGDFADVELGLLGVDPERLDGASAEAVVRLVSHAQQVAYDGRAEEGFTALGLAYDGREVAFGADRSPFAADHRLGVG